MKTPSEPGYRKRVGYQAALLGGFSTIATILLVMGNIATKDTIILRQQDDLRMSLEEVIPAKYYTNELLDNPVQMTNTDGQPVTIYRGTKEKKVSVLAWEIIGQGYSGEMRYIMAISNAGQIIGVRVLAHAETPGLGDKMEVEKDPWILQFNGLSLDNPPEAQWKVKKDGGRFDAFTGATITPRGIVKAIADALKFYRNNQSRLTHLEPAVELKPEPVVEADKKTPTATPTLQTTIKPPETGVNSHEQ